MSRVKGMTEIKASDLASGMRQALSAKSKDHANSTKFDTAKLSRFAKVATTNQKRVNITFLPQLHDSPFGYSVSNIKNAFVKKLVARRNARLKDQIARSQYKIARELHEKTAQLPRSQSAFPAFKRNHSGKIVYVFLEGIEQDLTISHNYLMQKQKPGFYRRVRKIFPGGKLPNSFEQLTAVQKKVLREEGAPTVLFLLGRSLILKGADKEILGQMGLASIELYTVLSMLFDMHIPFMWGDKFDPFCLRYGKSNSFRTYVYDSREKEALKKIQKLTTSPGYDPKRKKYLVYGASHRFPKYSGLKVTIPSYFSKTYKEADNYGLNKMMCKRGLRQVSLLLMTARMRYKRSPILKKSIGGMETLALGYLKDMWNMSEGVLTMNDAMGMSNIDLVVKALRYVSPFSVELYLEFRARDLINYAEWIIGSAFKLLTFQQGNAE